jgi:hypothetical protein
MMTKDLMLVTKNQCPKIFSTTPFATVACALLAIDKLFIEVVIFTVGYLGRPVGMITSEVAIGTTPLPQLAGSSQTVLTLPVQL